MDDDCEEQAATIELEMSSVYTDYVSFSHEGIEHPGKLWETKSLNYAHPPVPEYNLKKKQTVKALSNAQIDAVKLAVSAMEKMLPDGSRQGFYLGDGAGVGKGCIIAALFGEFSAQGEKRGVWVSCSNTLLDAAVRDMFTVGLTIRMLNLADYKAEATIQEDGILFVTYSMLVSCSNTNSNRMDQIIKWLSSDHNKHFEGLIAFDESHKGKHYSAEENSTKTGDAVVLIQNRLSYARVLYSSATALSEIDNIGYLSRLGLYGEGTSYKRSTDLIASLRERGVSSMELLSVELKQRGVFISRILSMEGINFEVKYCEKDLSVLYDKCAKLWNLMYHMVDPEKKLFARYWAYHQRFFSSLILASKIHDTVKIVKKAVKEGKSVVIGLQETGEARYNDVKELDQCFSTTREILIMAATELCGINFKKRLHHFSNINEASVSDDNPMNHWEDHLNQDWGTKRKTAIELYKEVAFSLPPNPIDNLLFKLGGSKKVAELTGRRSRQIRTRSGFEIERRNPKIDNEHDRKVFMLGLKRIAIISDACSTGISLHDEKSKNNLMGKIKMQRVHITLQYSWSADKVVQQLGRTHRSNSASNPHYIMLFTQIPAEQRFLSGACKKLKTLGALTQGERRASHLDETLNTGNNYEYWKPAIHDVCREILTNRNTEECEPLFVGFRCVKLVYCRKGVWKLFSVLKDVPKFLNRIMALPTSVQKYILDMVADTVETIIQNHRESKMLDEGIKDMVFGIGSKTFIQQNETFVINNSKIQLMTIQVDRSLKWKVVEGLIKKSNKKHQFFKKGGRPILAFEENQGHINEYSIYRPNNCVKTIVPDFLLQGHIIKKDEAQTLWQQQYFKLADGRCLHKLTRPFCPYEHCVYGNSKYNIHILFGSTLNIYDGIYKLCGLNKLHFSVARVMLNDSKIIGLIIPQEFHSVIREYLENLSENNSVPKLKLIKNKKGADWSCISRARELR